MSLSMSDTAVSHSAADMSRWTGRAEPFETARARYWYQIAQPYTFDNSSQALNFIFVVKSRLLYVMVSNPNCRPAPKKNNKIRQLNCNS